MVGIVSYGAYLPYNRLSRKVIADAWNIGGAPGEKAVAGWDEDSVTMAVDAGQDCLKGFDASKVEGLFLATTTPPYTEKLSSSLVASAMDLPRALRTSDSTDSLRAGTIALNSAIDAVKGGSLKNALLVAADTRLGTPASDFEQLLGDGAASLLLGDSGVIANILNSYSITEEAIDVWRITEDRFVRAWEDRWIVTETYTKVLQEAVSGVMKRSGLAPKDFAKAVVYAHDGRSHAGVVSALGFTKAQIQDPLITTVGHTGAAQALMMLVAALETAKPGDKILFASYGDGSDAYVLQVTDQIEKARGHKGIKGHLEPKNMVSNYGKYLRWRQLLPIGGGRRPPMPVPSATARLREGKRISALYAQKCRNCGTVQYHEYNRMRVCSQCQTKDQFDEVSLSIRKGKIFTYTIDSLIEAVDPPIVFGVIDLDGGGRLLCQGTNIDPKEVQIGMPVEMCFRKLYTAGGIHNYFWKFRPVR